MIVPYIETVSYAHPAKERCVGLLLDPFAILMGEDELGIYSELFLKGPDLREQGSDGIGEREITSVLRDAFLVLDKRDEMPKSAVTYRKPRRLSEEQREAARERARGLNN